jgi:hypothetical protein
VPPDDRTDLLPPVSEWPQHAAGLPLHERLRRAAGVLAWGALTAVLSALLLVICWAAVILSWAIWKAR